MRLGIITLFCALSISVVAAYFSITGLAALFAASMIPVIIMGGVLEVGKLSAVVWLHRNWKGRKFNNWTPAPKLLKIYLSSAVIILMLITSMGIFGFLSKGHLDQITPMTSIKLKIERIDQQVSLKNKQIKQYQRRLDQLDTAINKYLDRDYVSKALRIRKKQQPERKLISLNIKQLESEIDILLKNKLKERQKVSITTAKLGPVKYAAELLFTNPEKNMDKAVRLVILAIIFVFDPLAILLVLASSFSFMNMPTSILNNKKENKKERKESEFSNNDIVEILKNDKKVVKDLLAALNEAGVYNKEEKIKKTKVINKNNPVNKKIKDVDNITNNGVINDDITDDNTTDNNTIDADNSNNDLNFSIKKIDNTKKVSYNKQNNMFGFTEWASSLIKKNK